jgi:Fic family protein|tara:strand:+ start:7 stop:1194 length:1188 start_codon:yes stop_codon:yes gene_type:complete
VDDRKEQISEMEPLFIRDTAGQKPDLADLALVLTEKSAALRSSLPAEIASALANLVRSMNCYYSNLIEGHDTHPIDIERALNGDFSNDPEQRNLQLEAKAHIKVQEWIDQGGLAGRSTRCEGLLETHQRFCELLPEELLWIEDPKTKKRMKVIPGALRESHVSVGSHIGISPGALPRFMKRFEEAYSNIGKLNFILSTASAHHRFLWIHPFLEGNGRVARLMSYAMLREILSTGGIWSVARGLARNEKQYKQLLSNCDSLCRNDFDGRGTLSEEALIEFTRFFLEICIDQVDFVQGLMQPQRLRDRIMIWCEEEIRAGTLPTRSEKVLSILILQGEIPRGDVAELLGTGERSAQRVTKALIERGIITSQSTRAPLHLSFPAALTSRWMPGLFPEK